MTEKELKKLKKTAVVKKAELLKIDIKDLTKKELIKQILIAQEAYSEPKPITVKDIVKPGIIVKEEIKPTIENKKAAKSIFKEVSKIEYPKPKLKRIIPISVQPDVMIRSGNVLDKNDIWLQGTKGSFIFNFSRTYCISKITIIAGHTFKACCFKKILLISNNNNIEKFKLPIIKSKEQVSFNLNFITKSIKFHFISKYGGDAKLCFNQILFYEE